MGGKPVVSVVIPAFNRTDMLRKAVLSLFAQDFPKNDYQVVVVDSSLDDGNETMLTEVAIQATCGFRFFRKKPEGPGPSRNLGATRSNGEFIAFMDSDCFATPGWLRAGLAAFSDGVGIVQGMTLPAPDQKTGALAYYQHIEKETFTYETANIFYRRSAFEQTEGFPTDPHAHRAKHLGGEDLELAWTVKRNGWKTSFAEEALVYHEVHSISPVKWIAIKHLFVFPRLVRMFPELRQFMCASYFWNLGQAFFTLLLLGLISGVFIHWAGFLLFLPYAIYRALEPSGTLRGPLRAIRVFAYLSRDICSFGILLAASIRYRCLLL